MTDDTETTKKRRVTLMEFNQMPKEEQILLAARASLAHFGTLVPPTDANYYFLERKCTKCGKTKPVLPHFNSGKKGSALQGWCKECRSDNTNFNRTRDQKVTIPKSVQSKLSKEELAEIVKAVEAARVKGGG